MKISGLVNELYSKEVVSAVETDDINAEMTSFRANEKLLSVLSRKSPQQFQLFLDALDNCGQQHVRNVITGRRPGLTTLLMLLSCNYWKQMFRVSKLLLHPLYNSRSERWSVLDN